MFDQDLLLEFFEGKGLFLKIFVSSLDMDWKSYDLPPGAGTAMEVLLYESSTGRGESDNTAERRRDLQEEIHDKKQTDRHLRLPREDTLLGWFRTGKNDAGAEVGVSRAKVRDAGT